MIDPGDRPVPLGGPRARELLALLLLNPNRPLSSDRLVTAMWGESASDGAATTLRTHVAAVRRVLAAAGAGDALETPAGGLPLALDPADLDAEVFEGLVDRGQEALGIGEPDPAAALLGDALALWRGDVLTTSARRTSPRPPSPGSRSFAWSREETAMAAAARARDSTVRWWRGCRIWWPHTPSTSGSAGQLMLALYRSGRQVDALAAYAETKQRLAEELGLDPGPDLQALDTAVLRQDPALLLSVDDLHSRHGGGSIPPTPRPPDRPPGSRRMPCSRRSARAAMVGRDAGFATLTRHWREARRRRARRLVAWAVPAGVGKSRLGGRARPSGDPGRRQRPDRTLRRGRAVRRPGLGARRQRGRPAGRRRRTARRARPAAPAAPPRSRRRAIEPQRAPVSPSSARPSCARGMAARRPGRRRPGAPGRSRTPNG